jgi:hypothetical protein
VTDTNVLTGRLTLSTAIIKLTDLPATVLPKLTMIERRRAANAR